jgi:3-oxoacyl-[acyl-carrier protein] reductase
MDLGIRGKVALVTGGSDGLGLASATMLAREGVALAIAARDKGRLAVAADRIAAETGAKVLAVAADVSQREQAASLMEQVVSRLGTVEILVANAGGPKPGRFDDFGWSDWLNAFELVVGSVHHLASAVLPGSRTERILQLGRHRNPGLADGAVLESLGASMPIGRLVEPVEVGAAVAYLCSVPAAAITGSFLPVDGGQIRSQM